MKPATTTIFYHYYVLAITAIISTKGMSIMVASAATLRGSNRNLGAVLKPRADCGVYAPVYCEYGNPCVAKQANYSENDCFVLVVDTECAVYAPVVCVSNSTEFGNICAAKQAGYAESADCTSLHGSNRNLQFIIGFLPVQTLKVTSCGVYAPVYCSSNDLELKQQYDNLCLAEQAGYAESDCTSL